MILGLDNTDTKTLQTTAGNPRHKKCKRVHVFSKLGRRNGYWYACEHAAHSGNPSSASNFVALDLEKFNGNP